MCWSNGRLRTKQIMRVVSCGSRIDCMIIGERNGMEWWNLNFKYDCDYGSLWHTIFVAPLHLQGLGAHCFLSRQNARSGASAIRVSLIWLSISMTSTTTMRGWMLWGGRSVWTGWSVGSWRRGCEGGNGSYPSFKNPRRTLKHHMEKQVSEIRNKIVIIFRVGGR